MSAKSIIKEKSFKFSIQIVNTNKYLVVNKKEFILSKQVLRSGTAVGALVREAQNAESKKDFIHKLSIAQKECDETCYWLELLKETKYLNVNQYNKLYTEANSLLKMIRSAILTTKKTYNP